MITMSLNPGKLDRRIILRAPDHSRTPSGEDIVTWIEVQTIWAAWLSRDSDEFIAAQARNAETTGVVRIRHRIDITAQWQFTMGDDVFEVIGDPVEVGRREYLDLPVRALNQSPGDALSVCQLHDRSPRRLHDGSYRELHAA